MGRYSVLILFGCLFGSIIASCSAPETSMPTIVVTQTKTQAPPLHLRDTSTPEPPTSCPPDLSKQVPTLEYNGVLRLGVEESVFLDYLNQYGIDAFLQEDQHTRDAFNRLDPHVLLHQDLTNDDIPEIVVSYGPFYIFGCQDGLYTTLLATDQSAHDIRQSIVSMNDLNQNGVPEILVLIDAGTQADTYYRLFEWGTGKFESLFSYTNPYNGSDEDTVWVLSQGKFRFEDIDQDGMVEIVIDGGSHLTADYNGSAPWRKITYIYKWNGEKFALARKSFEPPQYRFQAVEDADYAAIALDFDRALALYQQAIFDDKLEWWTGERKEYIIQETLSAIDSRPLIATPPTPEPDEYLYLSAYARFRIMVIHLMRGHDSDAQGVYQTLLEKYPEGTPGSIYAQMAQAFWDSFQTNQDMGIACGKTREVANSQEEEVTRYLVDDYIYDGYPKEKYTIDQLCPFN